MMDDRMFTVGEANNLVPELESSMREIQHVRRFVVGIRQEIQKARDKISSNGGSRKGPSYLRALEHIMKEFVKAR